MILIQNLKVNYFNIFVFDHQVSLMKPACGNLYNLFHLNDPSALRLEPLLSARFSYIPAINVARYQKFPLGDGQPIHLCKFS